MADRFEFNMAGLIDLSNEVLDDVCIPLAKSVLAAAQADAAVHAFDTGAYHDSLRLEVDRRTGADDWAHVAVMTDDPKSHAIEARQNILGRAIANAGGA